MCVMIVVSIINMRKNFIAISEIPRIKKQKKSQRETRFEADERIHREAAPINILYFKMAFWIFVLFCDIWVAFADLGKDISKAGEVEVFCSLCGVTLGSCLLLHFVVFNYLRRDDATVDW